LGAVFFTILLVPVAPADFLIAERLSPSVECSAACTACSTLLFSLSSGFFFTPAAGSTLRAGPRFPLFFFTKAQTRFSQCRPQFFFSFFLPFFKSSRGARPSLPGKGSFPLSACCHSGSRRSRYGRHRPLLFSKRGRLSEVALLRSPKAGGGRGFSLFRSCRLSVSFTGF